MNKSWTLGQAREWLWTSCAKRYLADPAAPGWAISFQQPPSPDALPDDLILRAFRVLEKDGFVTGHVIPSHNAGALRIRGLQLSDQAILQLEAAADAKLEAPRNSIGFSNE